MLATTASKRCRRSGSRFAERSSVLTSAALVDSSSSRCAISASENFADSISPCSVTFRRPATVPGGCARIAV